MLYRILSVLAAVFILTACQASPTATPAPRPTQLPVATTIPTDTPAPTDEPSPTPIPPSETPAPTLEPTETPPPPVATTRLIVNVRAGPGAAYPLIGKLKKGESVPILGKSEDSQWWQIDFEGKPGWIAADFTDVQGGTNAVPVVFVERPPTPTAVPTRAAVGRPAPTATPMPELPMSRGRVYFVVKQEDGGYATAWVRPDDKDKVYSDVMLGSRAGDFDPALSTNATPLDWSERAGKLAYVIGSGGQNKLQTIDQNQNVVDVASHAAIVTPRWFDDGTRLAYVGYDNRVGDVFANQRIYLVNADGSGLVECFPARSGETLRGLDVAPGSGEIVFVSNYSGSFELWKMGSDCASPIQLTQDNADTSAPSFSPDGRRLAYVSNKAGATSFDIYLANADGSDARRLIEGFSPVFSPDGNWIAFSRNGQVYLVDINGNQIQTLAPGYRPAWAQE